MMRCAIYSTETGKISKIITVSSLANLKQNMKEGQSYLKLNTNDTSMNYVIDGKPVYIAEPVDEVKVIRRKLMITDSKLTRSVEDLVLALINKNIISKADLPREMAETLNKKEELRTELKSL